MKKKHLPRLWCALQGLLPLESCLAAQRAELAWPPEPAEPPPAPKRRHQARIRVARPQATVKRPRRASP